MFHDQALSIVIGHHSSMMFPATKTSTFHWNFPASILVSDVRYILEAFSTRLTRHSVLSRTLIMNDAPEIGGFFTVQFIILYWLVVSNMFFIFHNKKGIILAIDFHIFQRGRYTTNQCMCLLGLGVFTMVFFDHPLKPPNIVEQATHGDSPGVGASSRSEEVRLRVLMTEKLFKII